MITLDEFLDRLCRLGVDRGPRGFPRKTRDREILMKSILVGMDSGRRYRESEINALLQDWLRDVAPAIDIDHVSLRRWLVDYGHLERTASGRAYRVGFPPGAIAFELEVDQVDPKATVGAYREWMKQRSREKAARAAPRTRERRERSTRD